MKFQHDWQTLVFEIAICCFHVIEQHLIYPEMLKQAAIPKGLGIIM